MTYGPDGNPVGYDAGHTIATFDEPCPCCGERLEVIRGSYGWHQRARIETACPECDWEGVWFASPAMPLSLGYTTRQGAVQMPLQFKVEVTP